MLDVELGDLAVLVARVLLVVGGSLGQMVRVRADWPAAGDVPPAVPRAAQSKRRFGTAPIRRAAVVSQVAGGGAAVPWWKALRASRSASVQTMAPRRSAWLTPEALTTSK